MTKTCFKCNRTLELLQFYKHPQMADGHLNKCKDCTRLDSEQNRKKKMLDPDWVMAEMERQRKKQRISNATRPEVHRARRAIRSLERSTEWHWHHWSYKKEHALDVIKLSPQEHRRAHRFMVFDAEHLQYRRIDTMELLDTRERHEEFLNGYVSEKPF